MVNKSDQVQVIFSSIGSGPGQVLLFSGQFGPGHCSHALSDRVCFFFIYFMHVSFSDRIQNLVT